MSDVVVPEGDKVSLAIQWARMYHKGQLDDTGKDYFEAHLKQVAYIISIVCPNDSNLIAAAYLHDILEDTDVSYYEILKIFGEDIVSLVMEVTEEGESGSYGKYFPRLKTKRGIILKFADRLSNLSRMESWSEKRQEHYLKKSKFWKDGSSVPRLDLNLDELAQLQIVLENTSSRILNDGDCSKLFNKIGRYKLDLLGK